MVKVLGGKTKKRPGIGASHVQEIQEGAKASEALAISERAGQLPSKLTLIPIEKITTTYNSRKVPFSLETFRAIDWPELGDDVVEADDAHRRIIEDNDLMSKLLDPNLSLDAVLAFLSSIRDLSYSTRKRLAQPPSFEANRGSDYQFYLLCGERRLLSFVYRGEVEIPGHLYTEKLSEEDRRFIKAAENIDRADLSTAETIDAFKFIFDQFVSSNGKPPNIPEFCRLTGKSKTTGFRYLKLFKSPKCDEIIRLITDGDFTMMDVERLVKAAEEGHVEDVAPIKTITKKPKPSEKSPKPLTLTDKTERSLIDFLLKEAASSSVIPDDMKAKMKGSESLSIEDLNSVLSDLSSLVKES